MDGTEKCKRNIPQYLVLVVSILLIQIPQSSTFSYVSVDKTLCKSKFSGRISHDSAAGVARTSSPLHAKHEDEDEIPSMDWLTDTLSSSTAGDKSASENKFNDESMSDLNSSPYLEEHSVDGDLGDVPIPTTGVSVSDEMEKAQKDRFYTQLVPIMGLGKGVKAVRILSSTTAGAYESVRYLVRLTRKTDEVDTDLYPDLDDIDMSDDDEDSENAAKCPDPFVMVDVPPFSEKIVEEMKSMMGPNGYLSSILVTSQECIHYDESPGVFSVRKADLTKWKKAFPDVNVVAYRMDVPRDCRDSITQRLDGYGPWAMNESPDESGLIFSESGRPLTVKEWDPDYVEDILSGKRQPPSDDKNDDNVDPDFTPDTIRANEEGKKVLAVYTPGRSYGSMTYVFPELQICASGFSLPIEDSRDEENYGMDSPGPALDHRGYITTSKAGMSRQIESASNFVNAYVDRFEIVLTARGDPFYLDGSTEDRRQTLLQVMTQYEKLGMIYEQLGISGN
eukprot:CAMPEP_0116115122 /NCGR_PEP_ID=MMETSP0329-20121206/339_1 /TAXON_ID=697910 /ORGANISM="Pseudo-nitzschia arenysensis, Strain B593" /LENGTH=505 /DNA_ID=CAMNT_0003608535 /DNA_START=47 /DNA_END=1564 /DNA_ORIENTATION=+